tara:strand:+ start:1385 stop:2482 length:1098 start_codon:yes stop_codon:yes gene_type:complete
MRLGLVGWGVASGNGGMNTDIACLGDFVTKWLIPKHPKLPLHDPYIERVKGSVEITFVDENDNFDDVINQFSEGIDGLLYIEHPIFDIRPYKFDIVGKFHSKNKKVFGIPMWEWWPEKEPWALNTDAIWAVTDYTNNYMHALADVLETRGVSPSWKNTIFGNQWGVNLNDFSYRQRNRAEEIVFVRGNAGYKDRKAGKIIIPELIKLASESEYKITIYSQAELGDISKNKTENLTLKQTVFPDRKSVYETGDIFIFCSYWEGLCHGIYEASYSGGLVLTTNTPPMNECVPAFVVDVEETSTEMLRKEIKKAIPSMRSMTQVLESLQGQDISKISYESHQWVKNKRDLSETMAKMHHMFSSLYLNY